MARKRWGSYANARSKSKAAVFADMLGSIDTVKSEAVDIAMPSNMATTDDIPANIVTHDGSGNVTISGMLNCQDVEIP